MLYFNLKSRNKNKSGLMDPMSIVYINNAMMPTNPNIPYLHIISVG